jgi:hypothetical protein
MKKFTLSILSLLVLLVSCSKDPVLNIAPEPAVTKTVEFYIAQGRDYSATQYDGVRAELRLVVSKDLLSTGSHEILWDSTFTMASLRDYPPMQTPLQISKSVVIYESKEAVRVSSSIRYVHANNATYQIAKGEVIPWLFTYQTFEIRL